MGYLGGGGGGGGGSGSGSGGDESKQLRVVLVLDQGLRRILRGATMPLFPGDPEGSWGSFSYFLGARAPIPAFFRLKSTDLEGLTFVQGSTLRGAYGVASYHFDRVPRAPAGGVDGEGKMEVEDVKEEKVGEGDGGSAGAAAVAAAAGAAASTSSSASSMDVESSSSSSSAAAAAAAAAAPAVTSAAGPDESWDCYICC